MGKQIHYIDNLRTIAIAAGIICTVLNSFAIYADAQNQSLYSAVFICINGIMPVVLAILFFISGFLNTSTLRIHTTAVFLQRKWHRLCLPWVAGAGFLAPEIAYLDWISKGGNPDVLSFYGTTYWHEAFTAGQYWFLAILIILCYLLGFCKKVWHTSMQHTKTAPPLSLTAAGIFFFLLCAALEGIRFLSGNHVFSPSDVLSFRLDYVVLAVFCFAAGIYAAKHRWLSAKGYTPSLGWFYAFAAVCLCYGILAAAGYADNAYFMTILLALFSLTGILGLLALFASHGNQYDHTAAAWASLSYAFYFVSEPIAKNTAFFLQMLHVSSFLKICLILLITFLYGYILSKYVLIHWSPFQRQHR